MFEFIEEDLKQGGDSTPIQDSEVLNVPQIGEIAVSVMPERFRPIIKKKKKGSFLMIAIIALFVIIAVASIVALLVLSQPAKKTPPPADQTTESSPGADTEKQISSATSTPTEIPQPTPPPVTSSEQSSQASPSQPQPVQEPQTQQTQSTSSLIQGVDTDGDTLTDTEERLYGTDLKLPDTDGDGFFDGEELKKLFDPTKSTSSRIEGSVLAHTYTNTPFKYRLIYPSSWAAKAVNATEREVIFTSGTGEFISLNIEDNPQSLSALDWYISTKNPGVNPDQLQTQTGDTWIGVVSNDARTLYFARRAEKGISGSPPLMYSLTYNLNAKNEVNFLATFHMMIQSITFTDLTFIK